jgi:hypothetical protein
LIATIARNLKGIIGAIEKFETTVPGEDRSREILEIVAFGRAELATLNEKLAATPTDAVGLADDEEPSSTDPGLAPICIGAPDGQPGEPFRN